MGLIVWGIVNWVLEPKFCKETCNSLLNAKSLRGEVDAELIPLFYDLTGVYIEDPFRGENNTEDNPAERIGVSDVAIFLYDLTGVYFSSSPSFITPLWFAAKLLGGLTYKVVEKIILGSINRIDNDKIPNLVNELVPLVYDLTGVYIENPFGRNNIIAGKVDEKTTRLGSEMVPLLYDLTGVYVDNPFGRNDDIEEKFMNSSSLRFEARTDCTICSLSKPLILTGALAACGGSFIAENFLNIGSEINTEDPLTFIKPNLICPVS